MSNTQHHTDTTCTYKVDKQAQQWPTVALLLTTNPLAEVLQIRRLGANRLALHKLIIADHTLLPSPQSSGLSSIEENAVTASHGYYYLHFSRDVAVLLGVPIGHATPLQRPPLNAVHCK